MALLSLLRGLLILPDSLVKESLQVVCFSPRGFREADFVHVVV